MKKFGTFNVIGWGMLIGGIFLCVFIKPWHVIGMWDIYTVLAMAAVILVGTIFVLYNIYGRCSTNWGI